MSRTISMSVRHGSYSAPSDEVGAFAMMFFSDMDGTYRNLINYVIQITGHGDREYWSDLAMLDMMVVIVECGGSWDHFVRTIVNVEEEFILIDDDEMLTPLDEYGKCSDPFCCVQE